MFRAVLPVLDRSARHHPATPVPRPPPDGAEAAWHLPGTILITPILHALVVAENAAVIFPKRRPRGPAVEPLAARPPAAPPSSRKTPP
jgi:hypothetical protein